MSAAVSFARIIYLVLFVLAVQLLPQLTQAQMPHVQVMRSVEALQVDESGTDLRFPSGVSYDRDGDEIYVTSPQTNKLVVLTPDYFPYLSIGSGRGLHSISKTYIRNGYLYVCVGASDKELRPHIAVYDMAFMPVRNIFFPDFEHFSPLDLVVSDDGKIYVVGMNGTGVMVLDNEGNFLRWIRPKGQVLGVSERAPILAIEIGLDGRLYMLSESMGRVFVYDRNERLLYQFGEKGGEVGKLSRPRGIAVDDVRRQVYLVDYQRHTMTVFAKTGEFLFEVGGLGAGRGWFYYPSDVVVDGRGRVIVADTFNHRVQVFEFISGKGFGQQEQPEQPYLLAQDEFVEEAVQEETQQPKEFTYIRRLKDELQLESEGDFLVVAVITKNQADAEMIKLDLARKGYPVILRELQRSRSGIWFQVLVGPYLDPLEGYHVSEQLRKEERVPAIMRTRGEAFELELPNVDEGGEG
ncbi:NHL repeat-containing protein [Malonomonas rubra DSM 5091]|uniref:NHL repeat-containing protein n=1 Tax=Malonomonas rubra DSM 5091 TaxID=1122189 RepID=A0A1M6C095_MALRU|nr:NHL repeat-containing protein [Malonomonas rubra]SHI54323.1 NHL repeat-containing protein [Malonomonas rubra DSM 5091]